MPSALDKKRKVRRVQLLGGQTYPLPKRTASCDGYNLNAGVVVRAEDRAGLERLSRYILRPPLAKARIERRADGTVRLGMKRAWSDGTLAFEFSPLEFVEKLAAILPPPRKNQVIYHGVLAGNSNAPGDCAETNSTARTLENALQTVKKSCSTPENSTGCASEALGRHWPMFLEWMRLSARRGGRLAFRCMVEGLATQKVLAGLERSRGPPL